MKQQLAGGKIALLRVMVKSVCTNTQTISALVRDETGGERERERERERESEREREKEREREREGEREGVDRGKKGERERLCIIVLSLS